MEHKIFINSRALLLSQYKGIAYFCAKDKSLSKWRIHYNSQIVIDLYSASIDDLNIVVYFLDLQETKDEPMKTQKLAIDFFVSEQPTQFELEKTTNCKGLKEA